MTTMTDDELKDAIGVVALDEYRGAPDFEKPKLNAWIGTLRDLSDDEFLTVARSAIYHSALTASWRGNWNADHCRASACYHESRRRLVLAGHDRDCRGQSLYSRAHSELMCEHGYAPTAAGVCECANTD